MRERWELFSRQCVIHQEELRMNVKGHVNRVCVEAHAISPPEFTFITSRSHLKTLSHDYVMCVIAYV